MKKKNREKTAAVNFHQLLSVAMTQSWKCCKCKVENYNDKWQCSHCPHERCKSCKDLEG